LSRAAAERLGRRAERVAALWLRLKGYSILARRVRTPVGEVDLIARRGKTLAFVEVKARRTIEEADAALAPAALARVGRAANLLLARYLGDCTSVRIDAVVMRPGRFPQHLVGVWDGEWR
jgi:putative endonuclease